MKDEWQPIETFAGAYYDRFLLDTPDGVVIGYLVESFGWASRPFWTDGTKTAMGDYVTYQPTHWRHVPEPHKA